MEQAVVNRHAVVVDVGVDFHEAVAEMDVPPGVMMLALHRGGDDRVDADNRGHDAHIALLQILRPLAVKRAPFIDDVPEGQRHGEGNKTVELQGEGIEAPHHFPLPDHLVADEHHAELGLRHRRVPEVGHTEHERGLSVEGADHHPPAEKNAGGGARKADEDQARDHGHAEHSRHDLQRRDNMTVETGGIEMAVTHGCKRLDAEEEGVGKGLHPRDAGAPEVVKETEEQVERQVEPQDEGGELQPVHAQHPVVEVPQVALLDVEPMELGVAGADLQTGCFLHWRLGNIRWLIPAERTIGRRFPWSPCTLIAVEFTTSAEE